MAKKALPDELPKQGLPAKEIAKTCECSIALVSKVEHAAGLERYGRRYL